MRRTSVGLGRFCAVFRGILRRIVELVDIMRYGTRAGVVHIWVFDEDEWGIEILDFVFV